MPTKKSFGDETFRVAFTGDEVLKILLTEAVKQGRARPGIAKDCNMSTDGNTIIIYGRMESKRET